MTETKSIEQIKDEVAVEHGFEQWDDPFHQNRIDDSYEMEKIMNEVCQRYADQFIPSPEEQPSQSEIERKAEELVKELLRPHFPLELKKILLEMADFMRGK